MNSSFYNGVSGMKTQQFGIDVWSNNISNISTAGYKSQIPEFSTIYADTLSGSMFDPSSNNIGMGSHASATTTSFLEGSYVDSDNKYDLAITGTGWFGITDQAGKVTYTRNGSFHRDQNGDLVDATGGHVLGESANNIIDSKIVENETNDIKFQAAGTQKNINIPSSLTYPASPTENITMKGNLSIKDVQGEENIEIFKTQLYNKDGSMNNLEITYTKRKENKETEIVWDAVAKITDSENTVLEQKEGILEFSQRGALKSNTLTSINNEGTVVNLNLGSIYDPSTPNSGFDGLVSMDDIDMSRHVEKDGFPKGDLSSYDIDGNGNVMANFDNGKMVAIAKVAIYNFKNEAGLKSLNSSHFKESVNSGKAVIFTDKNGNLSNGSSIQNSKLEMANVSLSDALNSLMIMQKAYEASSKSITTSDQMIQNAINMKK